MQGLARSAAGEVLAQAALHAELLAEAWREEGTRIRGVGFALLAGFACFLCTLLSLGTLLVALSWDGPLRVPVAAGLLLSYAAGTLVAWRSARRHAGRRNEALAASREELAADLRQLRGRS